MSSIGYTAFKLGYQLSPIILTGGRLPTMLPIIAITEAANFVGGLLQGNISTNLDQYFAHFQPLPGATLANNAIGKYPFANQSVAANAIIAQPLTISMLMICPAQGSGSIAKKLVTMTALKKAFDGHNTTGGTYTIATPAYIYTNCVMTGFKDVSSGEDKQLQHTFQLDFEQPLISLADAQTAYNTLTNVLQNGLESVGQPTWTSLASQATQSLVGGAQNLVGTAVNGVKSLYGG
jgi:hypothetical protein